MVTTDNHSVNTIVLTESCMEKAFSRACISHVKGIPAIDNMFRNKVTFDQGINTFNTNICRDITGFEVTDKRMDQNAVTDIKGNFAKMLMGSVHGVSKLHGSNICPASFIKNSPGFFRCQVNPFEFFREFAFGKHFYRACETIFFSGHNHLDTWVIFHGNFPEYIVFRLFTMTFIDFFTFPFFLIFGHFKFFFDFHGGKHFTISFEGNFITDINPFRIFFCCIQHYRNRPECTISQKEIFADTFPVRFGHKTIKRAEPTNTEHDQIAFNLGRNLNFFEAFCFFKFRFKFCAFKLATYQAFSTMRCY